MEMKHLDFPCEIKAAEAGDGTFTGYASTFGGPPDTSVTFDWEKNLRIRGDIIERRAFDRTLAEGGRNGTGIAMLYQHLPQIPVGVWTGLSTNEKGLKVNGKIAVKTSTGADVYELLKMDPPAIRGMSIGFDFYRDKEGKVEEGSYEIDEKKKIRHIKQVQLWEISLVTFPANTRATVTAVKSFLEAETPREMERALREAGHSKKEAQYLVSLMRPSLREVRKDEDGWAQALLESLRQANAKMRGEEAY